MPWLLLPAGGAWRELEGHVDEECQRNCVAIIKRSMELGINHFETARGYGCSELQYGIALKKCMDEGLFKREDFVLQTKVSPMRKRRRPRLACARFLRSSDV